MIFLEIHVGRHFGTCTYPKCKLLKMLFWCAGKKGNKLEATILQQESNAIKMSGAKVAGPFYWE